MTYHLNTLIKSEDNHYDSEPEQITIIRLNNKDGTSKIISNHKLRNGESKKY